MNNDVKEEVGRRSGGVDGRALKVALLRREIAGLQGLAVGAGAVEDGLGSCRPGCQDLGQQSAGRLGLGVGVIDRHLGGGLQVGRVHEFSGLAALGLVVLLAGRAGGDVLWCTPHGGLHGLYPPGLVALGLDPCRLIHVVARTRDDLYWAAEDGLRSKAVRVVVVEAPCAMSLRVARRLQLAAEAGSSVALILNENEAATAVCPVATTRWQVGHLCLRGAEMGSEQAQAQILGRAGRRVSGFGLTLVRNRSGGLGRWQVEWDETTHCLCLAAEAGDGSDFPAEKSVA